MGSEKLLENDQIVGHAVWSEVPVSVSVIYIQSFRISTNVQGSVFSNIKIHDLDGGHYFVFAATP